jgi:cytochrome c-type biogenesis protein CcmH
VTSRTKLLAWLVLALVVVGTLLVGGRRPSEPSVEARVEHLSEQIRCPICKGESVRDSQAPSAQQVKTQIQARVEAGESDADIRAALVGSYGEEILLNPPRSGIAGLVWVLPVAALVLAVAGLAVAFRRWRPSETMVATDEDLAAVERARQA